MYFYLMIKAVLHYHARRRVGTVEALNELPFANFCSQMILAITKVQIYLRIHLHLQKNCSNGDTSGKITIHDQLIQI